MQEPQENGNDLASIHDHPRLHFENSPRGRVNPKTVQKPLLTSAIEICEINV